MTRALAGKLPRSNEARSLTRIPMGGRTDEVSGLAQCRAGATYARRVRLTVKRSAWEIAPAATSS